MGIDLKFIKSGAFTIINRIPEDKESGKKESWSKIILENCGLKSEKRENSDGLMVFDENACTVFIYDWKKYLPPLKTDSGYYALSDGERAEHFTVKSGDLIVFKKIDDGAPSSFEEFNALCEKYKDDGCIVIGKKVYINFYPGGEPWETNHIEAVSGRKVEFR